MDLKLAPTIDKLIKTAVRLIINQHGAERAIVVYEERKRSKPKPRGVYGLENDSIWKDSSLDQKIFEYVLDRQDSLLLVDTEKDREFPSKGPYRSVVCVPLVGLTGAVTGFFYADHSEPRALDGQTREALVEMAVTFEQCYREIVIATGRIKKIPRQGSSFGRFVVMLAASAAIVLLPLGGMWLYDQLPEPQPPTTQPTADLAAAPRQVASDALAALKAGDLSGLSSHLSPELGKKVDEVAFADWQGGQAHLSDRQLLTVQVSGNRAVALVGVPGQAAVPVWKWRLAAFEGGWHLVELGESPFTQRRSRAAVR